MRSSYFAFFSFVGRIFVMISFFRRVLSNMFKFNFYKRREILTRNVRTEEGPMENYNIIAYVGVEFEVER